MKCPNCKTTSLVLSERKGVEIDYCPDCRGVWLDRGELDKILEKASAEQQTARAAAQPPPDGGYDRDSEYRREKYGHKPYKRKKSFFEELFD